MKYFLIEKQYKDKHLYSYFNKFCKYIFRLLELLLSKNNFFRIINFNIVSLSLNSRTVYIYHYPSFSKKDIKKKKRKYRWKKFEDVVSFLVEKKNNHQYWRKKILRAMKNGATRFSTIGKGVCAGNSATDRVSAFCSLFLCPTFSIEKVSCVLPTPRFHARILEFYCHET